MGNDENKTQSQKQKSNHSLARIKPSFLLCKEPIYYIVLKFIEWIFTFMFKFIR